MVINTLMFIPRTVEAAIGTTHGTAIVTVIKPIGIDSSGGDRRLLTQEEADALNAAKPHGSIKPDFKAGQWVGGYGSISTLFEARFEWADGSTEIGILEAPGGTHPDGTVLQFGNLELPKPGHSYLMFLRSGNGRHGPAPVSFEVVNGRLAPHYSNDSGLGRDWLDLPIQEAMARAEVESAHQAANPR